MGYSEFMKRYGRRTLEDNWRRSNKESYTALNMGSTEEATTGESDAEDGKESKDESAVLRKKFFITIHNYNYSRQVISQLTPDSKPCVKVSPHTAPLSLFKPVQIHKRIYNKKSGYVGIYCSLQTTISFLPNLTP